MNIELLRTLGKVKKYKKGEFICLEQEAGSTAYLLLQGKTDIILGSFLDKSRKVAQLEPGVIFGEMSLLENKARNASVQAAVDDTLVLEIEKSNFLEILKADSEIAWNLMRTLFDRMEKMMNEMKVDRFAAVAGYRKNALYLQLKGLTQEQFTSLIRQDSQSVFKLLKFLSTSLAEMNEEIMKQKK